MTATRFLADTSAVIRILRKQVPESWDELIERGQISICQAVEIEVLRASGGQNAYREWKRVLFAAFPLVIEPEMCSTEHESSKPRWQRRVTIKAPAQSTSSSR
jgi:hypothetical protein